MHRLQVKKDEISGLLSPIFSSFVLSDACEPILVLTLMLQAAETVKKERLHVLSKPDSAINRFAIVHAVQLVARSTTIAVSGVLLWLPCPQAHGTLLHAICWWDAYKRF